MKWNSHIMWRLIMVLSAFVSFCEPESMKTSNVRPKRYKNRRATYKFNLRKVSVRNAKVMNATCLGKFIYSYTLKHSEKISILMYSPGNKWNLLNNSYNCSQRQFFLTSHCKI